MSKEKEHKQSFRFLMNTGEPISEVPCWVKIKDSSLMTKRGITLFKGSSVKANSTMVFGISQLLINQRTINTLSPLDKPNLILSFDTVSDRATFQLNCNNMSNALGSESSHYVALSLLDVPLADRIATVKNEIENRNPDIVIFNSVAGFVNNCKDEEEAYHFREWLCDVSNVRSVFALIPTQKMKSWLGTEIEAWSYDTFNVSIDKAGNFSMTLVE